MKPEGVSGTNLTLKQLVRYAYEVQDWQILGPAWIGSDGYDVLAKTSGAASNAQLRSMLQI
jgi:uncharacterized protein (TIGR03435 family)